MGKITFTPEALEFIKSKNGKSVAVVLMELAGCSGHYESPAVHVGIPAFVDRTTKYETEEGIDVYITNTAWIGDEDLEIYFAQERDFFPGLKVKNLCYEQNCLAEYQSSWYLKFGDGTIERFI